MDRERGHSPEGVFFYVIRRMAARCTVASKEIPTGGRGKMEVIDRNAGEKGGVEGRSGR